MAWKWKTKLPPILDRNPPDETWVSVQRGNRWVPIKLHRGCVNDGYADHTLLYGHEVNRHNDEMRMLAQAWFDGRLFDNKAECEVDCSQRNLAEAESLMKASVGAP